MLACTPDGVIITRLLQVCVFLSRILSAVRVIWAWKTASNKTCQSGLYHLHNIRCIKIFLSFEDRKSIVQAIVISRIDYCNSLLYGVAATNLSELQGVQNAAVRLVCSLTRHEHVTSSFIRLHWLPIKFRINFKIAMLCFKCIHGQAPKYLKSMVAITAECGSSSVQNLVHFKFTEYGTEDRGSSSVQHLVNFKFTDYGTADCGISSVQHLVNLYVNPIQTGGGALEALPNFKVK